MLFSDARMQHWKMGPGHYFQESVKAADWGEPG
jgi:hypothetical protein